MATTFTVWPPDDADTMSWLREHDLDPDVTEIDLEVTVDDDGTVHLTEHVLDEAGDLVIVNGDEIATRPIVIANPKRPFPWPR